MNDERKEPVLDGVDNAVYLEVRAIRREDCMLSEENDGLRVYDKDNAPIYSGEGYWQEDVFIRHGKGEEYGANGKVRYRGNFVHNSITGHGTAYDEDGELLYEGDFSKGKWHGIGRSYYKNGKIHFEGSFFEGLVHGPVRAYYGSGVLSYEGAAYRGYIHGWGRKYNKSGVLWFEGQVNVGAANGVGRVYYEDGYLKYEGEMNCGEYFGIGREYGKNGKLLYEGGFFCGAHHGQGRLYDAQNGKLIREGSFSEKPEYLKKQSCVETMEKVRITREKLGLPSEPQKADGCDSVLSEETDKICPDLQPEDDEKFDILSDEDDRESWLDTLFAENEENIFSESSVEEAVAGHMSTDTLLIVNKKKIEEELLAWLQKEQEDMKEKMTTKVKELLESC